MKKIFHFLTIITFITLSDHYASAQKVIMGEIINVNYRYLTAFSDLSRPYVQPGDIVEIYSDGMFVTYLKVSETSTAISKLIPIKRKGPYKTQINFKKISIGFQVKKIDEEDASLFIEKTTEQLPRAMEQLPDTISENTLLLDDSNTTFSDDSFNQLQEDYNILNIKYSSSLESASKLQQNLQTQTQKIFTLRADLTTSQEKIERLIKKNQELERKNLNKDFSQQKLLYETCQDDLTNLNKKMLIIRKKLQYIFNILKRKMGNL
ncbi:MAG: hypothetical protein K8S27_10070 [Candidatus Omnitrophica bacterium]|nr:hypothetical protein [Candidatus Omnitrophota bacterium]